MSDFGAVSRSRPTGQANLRCPDAPRIDRGGGEHPWFPLAEMREAYDELNGCSIRRPGTTCEVRKEFLAVALFVLSEAIATQTTGANQ